MFFKRVILQQRDWNKEYTKNRDPTQSTYFYSDNVNDIFIPEDALQVIANNAIEAPNRFQNENKF